MKNKPAEQQPVSPNNPCPFLRALVADGKLADDVEPLGTVADVILATAATGQGHPTLPRPAILAIALIANGLGPRDLAKNATHGVRLNALRDGPLDKHGVGSGILKPDGTVDPEQIARLRSFATERVGEDGKSEPGLRLEELRAFMDANFERAKGRRRRVDRALMDGEWPVLLKVMGKESPGGRYLSVKDVVDLFQKRSLPARMQA